MSSQEEVEIHTGYIPGSIGRVIEMHGRYYSQAAGFGQYFESKVAAGLAEFMGRLSNPGNGFWTARHAGEIVGSVAIDAEDMGPSIAHLRWFIVSDAVRGNGLGKRLLTQAVQFCDTQGFSEIHLWTFAGLAAARKLYESAGFALVEEFSGTQWGREVTEQRFVRPISVGPAPMH